MLFILAWITFRFLAQEPLLSKSHPRAWLQAANLIQVVMCVCVPSIKQPWTACVQIHPRHAAAMRRSSLVFPRIASLLKWHPSSLCSLLLCSSHYNERARVSEKQFRCRAYCQPRKMSKVKAFHLWRGVVRKLRGRNFGKFLSFSCI